MEQLSNKNPRIEVVDALRGFAVMAHFSRLSHRFTNLAKYIGPGSIKRYFYPTCRKILRNLRSPVRIYILHSEQ